MNTTKKGDEFEKAVFRIVRKELNDQNLPLPVRHSKMYRKKGYFSRDRGSNIITDISIEVTLPSADTYSILMVIECKNYNHKVPVDDIEEFYAKVCQISGLNVKAVFVSQNALQEGALNYAKSKGIAVWRILPDNQITHVLHCIDFDEEGDFVFPGLEDGWELSLYDDVDKYENYNVIFWNNNYFSSTSQFFKDLVSSLNILTTDA